ncbi:sensor histidine kinase [Humibacillus xanthopallidus]|uniref:sensor histidine kinase n=1 Tax=Humibacillus xanthopallidus TaxID=412689 RepID=UPI00114E7A1A|nr:HAMP domain-containing sensor histidine kinase [Humibacillus xanthopallidus]
MRTASRSIALRVGATTAVVVLLAVIAAGVVYDRQQLASIRDRVTVAATTADDVVDAPPGTWIIEHGPTGTKATAGTPRSILAATEGMSLSGENVVQSTTVEADGTKWPAAIAQREDTTFIAVYDMRLHDSEESRLFTSMAVAGILGVLLAAATGLIAGRRAVRPLAQALDLQRQFVADASHELRTPLSVISIRAQMLRRHLKPDDEATRAQVDQLVADTKVMGDVVSDLLLSAQLEQSGAATDAVDLVAVAEGVARSLEPYAAEAGVALTWPVSAERAPVVVDGVSTSLRRAVLALVDNAISHSPEGGTVEVTVQQEGDWAWARVTDHGTGVDPDDIARLTQRFARDRRGDGSRRVGLGLALVTQIVRSHGGRLDVSQTPGGGATFALVLPLSPPFDDDDED